MSHFTRIKTKIVEREFLLKALADLGHACQEGKQEIRGYSGNRTPVDIKIATKSAGFDIGFQKTGEAFELVADWWGTLLSKTASRKTWWDSTLAE
jgi:hypothetical protein